MRPLRLLLLWIRWPLWLRLSWLRARLLLPRFLLFINVTMFVHHLKRETHK